MRKVYFIAGASRGMGLDFVRAALLAGHAVVATARDLQAFTSALRAADHLLGLQLDVTTPRTPRALRRHPWRTSAASMS
jgi:NAD(P)-dependent dehydrogenase (short-subunit alcohol dehydrogenase family)